MNKQYRYLEIVEKSTREAVLRLDITGMGENKVERTTMGMLMRIDTDNFYVDEDVFSDVELHIKQRHEN